ncbi:GDSL-type esterase/lipase family protein [Bifidobacterium cuniculi]|uniref:Endoglucanase E n=1 Tax=Bifidobacterium cuniculi TaxID=1688 RepID=A0A087B3D1_9BIFI|nr:GDSL-type esterase/lipase family protein [Bifidobacterium cuniculi]KFI65531.1 endoglucanase E [Bifidobacterium cuniculi]
MRQIAPLDPAIHHEGRAATQDGVPLWVFPYTQARFRFSGTTLAVRVRSHWNYGHTRIGVIIDNTQFSLRLPSPDEPVLPANVAEGEDGVLTVTVATDLPDVEHEAVVFKRQDGGMHYLEFHGVAVDDGAHVAPPQGGAPTDPMAPGVPPLPDPARRIEFYGDSVTCGERNEAVTYTGMADPDIDLSSDSNSWYSYAAITGRMLGAETRLISQGGIPLLDGIGWFNAPDYLGMESMWDKVAYNPPLGDAIDWDFHDFTPQVVVVALGQNDSHPDDFMAQDYEGGQAATWRREYRAFLGRLLERYPHAHVVCTTTVLEHDDAWDRAIHEVATAMEDPRVTHFAYSRAGTGTPGHPRVAEDVEMARELVTYLESMGEGLWA